ncbi:fimbrial protein [Pseudomonas sp. FSL R10-1350]|uniref:fimbrial protein n=1 Tax=Pseudomonas TaxID=286 RepID=UPI003555E910
MNVITQLTITSSFALLMVPFNNVVAAGQQNGVVTLGGEILDAACAMDTSSAYQVIEMDPMPIGRLIRLGEGDPHSFTLRLINCSLTRNDPDRPGEKLPDWQHIRVTFDGVSDRQGLSFAANGSSQGVAFHITDAEGRESFPGVPMTMIPLSSVRDQVLHYTLKLVGNNQPLSVGSHRAAVRFRLEYY